MEARNPMSRTQSYEDLTISSSHAEEVFELAFQDRFMLETPIRAEPLVRLSSAPLTKGQIELGKKIAQKHGLTE